MGEAEVAHSLRGGGRPTWWIDQEPHLELLFLCAPPNLFRSESDVLSRWDIGTNDGRRQVNGLCARYDLNRREAASG